MREIKDPPDKEEELKEVFSEPVPSKQQADSGELGYIKNPTDYEQVINGLICVKNNQRYGINNSINDLIVRVKDLQSKYDSLIEQISLICIDIRYHSNKFADRIEETLQKHRR